MSPAKQQSVDRAMEQLREFIDAKYRIAEKKRRAKGCIDIADLCRMSEQPECFMPEIRQHILACRRCRQLYEAILEGYPHLARPSWMASTTRSDSEPACQRERPTGPAPS
jgi:hypothetical protein